MTPVGPQHRRRRPTRRVVAASLLGAGAVAALTVALLMDVAAPVRDEVSQLSPTRPYPLTAQRDFSGPAVSVPSASSTGTRPAPTRLAVASIGVTTDLVDLGVNQDNTVEVPSDPSLAGWFSLGTPPGGRGSAVILGHVDSVDGPAVFARLKHLRRGDVVVVDLSDGTARRFRVERVVTYANAEFPAQQVYAGTESRRLLNLVTCGGEYDAERGGWQSNVVVYTELIG